MNPLRGCLASLALSTAAVAVAAAAASASPSLVNAGFESGSTAGWQGTGTATRSYAGYTAPAGSYFGLVRSPGCPGEVLEQRFSASEGDVVTGWAFFRTVDALPYDDHGDVEVKLEQTGTTEVVFGSRVAEVGGGGATPWSGFAYTIPQTGRYAIRIAVENVLDCGQESAVGLDMTQVTTDGDVDGVVDGLDNCAADANPDQLDTDADGHGDACDHDDDNDAVDDSTDNCPLVPNTEQSDNDADHRGDPCDPDDDDDAVEDAVDNCPLVANSGQVDDDGDGTGNACDGLFDSMPGKATGGGWIAYEHDRLSFSLSARSKSGTLEGTCSIALRRTRIKCLSLDGYYQDPLSGRVILRGDAILDGVPTRYRIAVGDDGGDDRLGIATDSGFSARGPLGGGNIQIHRS